MAHATPYAALKALLVTRWKARTGLAGVEIGYQFPVDVTDVESTGSGEAVWFETTEDSPVDSVVFCGPDLRFDGDGILPCRIQKLGSDSLDDLQAVESRVQEILYELIASFAESDDLATDIVADATLAAFDYLTVTLAGYSSDGGRLRDTKIHGAAATLDIRVEWRRSYP